jgi:hypothetical protein
MSSCLLCPSTRSRNIEIGPSGLAKAITMIQSNFNDPGNLEVIGLQEDGGLAFLFRDQQGWEGPITM